MHVYGITGPSGSGKSIICEYMSERGIPHIDADKVYAQLLIPPSEALDALCQAFGDSVITSDGQLDRRALSSIVFNDEKKLALLNATVLPIVLKELRIRIHSLEKQGFSAVAIDAPTLIESGFNNECDTVISVLCPKELRIKRIMARDGLTLERATERTNAQKPDEFYIGHSDTVLINDGDREKFYSSLCKALPHIFED